MRSIALMLAFFFLSISLRAAHADDFASDLAGCAKGPIDATKFALGDAKTAAEFTINHGECVPSVVSGDPLLYGLSGFVAILQAHGDLPQGAQACIDASVGQASKPIAGAIDTALSETGLNSLLPADGRSLLRDIANGHSQATLYEVPGIAQVMHDVSCSCAVASTGLDAKKLKERLTSVIEAAGDCKAVLGKILGGAYDTAKSAAKAAGAAAKAAYETAKDAINSVGCTLGLGGCKKSGPPFFCTGYNNLRGQGWSPAKIGEMFNGFPFTSMGSFGGGFDENFKKMVAKQTADALTNCEQGWANMLAQAAQKQADEAEAKRLDAEREKSEQLGSSYALGFAFRWSPLCKDDLCRTGIAKMADQYTAEMNDSQNTIGKGGYGSAGAAKNALDKKYGERAKLAILLSNGRNDKALRADENAPPVKRLPAFGCRSFLGRERQSLCTNPAGLKVCKDYAVRGLWDMCALAGKDNGFFAAGDGLDRVLRQAGCIPENSSVRSTTFRQQSRAPSPRPAPYAARASVKAQCLSTHARVICETFELGGSSVSCEGPALLVLNRPQMRQLIDQNPPDIARPEPNVPERQPPTEAPPTDAPPVYVRPVRPYLQTPVQPLRPVLPPAVQTSTLCRFTSGPRAGETQDYAPMAPIPVGSSCQDARGSFGTVVAR